MEERLSGRRTDAGLDRADVAASVDAEVPSATAASVVGWWRAAVPGRRATGAARRPSGMTVAGVDVKLMTDD